ncbi:unnamed protein product [Moneuplotes crassus]|uniref:Uncharacterized protein n=1 Tax=Euplotes crassus TaxID=5936 RepID=A0AAD2CYS8_EUPCR|nr:unnamed protein product [Moneuplotes crassus]
MIPIKEAPTRERPFYKVLLDLNQVEEIQEDFGEILYKTSQDNFPEQKNIINCSTKCENSHICDTEDNLTPDLRSQKEEILPFEGDYYETSNFEAACQVDRILLKSYKDACRIPQPFDSGNNQKDKLIQKVAKANIDDLGCSENSKTTRPQNINNFSYKESQPVEKEGSKLKKMPFSFKTVIQVPQQNRKRKSPLSMTKNASGNYTMKYDSFLKSLRMKIRKGCTIKRKIKQIQKEIDRTAQEKA